MAAPSNETRQQLKGRFYYVIFWDPAEAAGSREHLHPQHIAYVTSLERDGRLLGAGPFCDEAGGTTGRGMFILRVETLAEAEAVAQADPYYRAGFRTYTIRRWRRSEGSMTIRIGIADNHVTLD